MSTTTSFLRPDDRPGGRSGDRSDNTVDDEPGSGGGRRRRLSGRRRLTMVVAGVVVLAVFVTWLVAFSSALGVRSVQVRGTHNLTVAEVQGRADVRHGTPLVRIDSGAITARVETLPDVYSAQVRTSLPSTVVITVVERTPVGYVRGADGIYRLVDRTGDQYRNVVRPPGELPKLVVAAGTDSRTTGGAVAEVAAALPHAFLAQVKSIEALDPRAITLLLTRDRVVQWGTAKRSADKAEVLPILLRKKSHSRFDVSDPDRPYSN